MNYFQMFLRPDQRERMSFLGYWIVSLIIWSFMLNISLIIVIVFSIVGYHLICKPIAFLMYKLKIFLIKNVFDGFDIFEAYYAGLESGRIVRIVVKFSFILLIFTIARLVMESYLAFIG